jgi:hypothetical protein
LTVTGNPAIAGTGAALETTFGAAAGLHSQPNTENVNRTIPGHFMGFLLSQSRLGGL